MSDEIERLRAHLEKHRGREQAFFSIAGLTALLDLLDNQQARMDRNEKAMDIIDRAAARLQEMVEGDELAEMTRQRDELSAQVMRLLTKLGERVGEALVARHHETDEEEAR